MLLIRDQLFARLCPRWQSLVVDARRPAEKEGRDSQHLVLNTQLIAVPVESGSPVLESQGLGGKSRRLLSSYQHIHSTLESSLFNIDSASKIHK